MKTQTKRLIAIGVLLNVAAIGALFWLVLDMRSDRQSTTTPTFRSSSFGENVAEWQREAKLDALIEDATREAQDRKFERGW